MSDACLMAFVLFCLFVIFSVKHETRSLTENSINRGEDDKTTRCLKRMKEEKINLESGRVFVRETLEFQGSDECLFEGGDHEHLVKPSY